jgi:hypothetical protein
MKTTLRISAGAAALALAVALSACGGSHGSMLPSAGSGSPFGADAAQGPLNARAPIASLGANAADPDGLQPDKKAKIKITPKTLALAGTGSAQVLSFTISEANYKGKFKAASTCKPFVTLKPANAKGPKTVVKVTPKKAGTCTITYTDTAKNSAKISMTVTTATMSLGTLSFSPGSKSAKAVLTSVNGAPPKAGSVTTAITALSSTCLTAGCAIALPPSPAGNDAYSITIYDAANAAGNVLAQGTSTAAVTAGLANVITGPQLAKNPKALVFAGLAAGSAGTAFTHSLALSVQDADGNAIVGNYSTPVSVSDPDTTPIAQGTALKLNPNAATRTVSLTNSNQTMSFVYGGLAITPVKLTASATGATSGSVTFTVAVPALVYAGPLNGSAAEIDLYNPTASQPGNSGSFTITQAGWTPSPFSKKITFALGGTGNNCTSYAVTPASGTAAAYTVKVGATPVAGTCTMTLTGGPGGATSATKAVLLTYTTGSIGISAKHRKP